SLRDALPICRVAVDEVAEADLVVRAGLDLDRPDVPAGIEGGRLERAGPLEDVVGPVEMEGDAGRTGVGGVEVLHHVDLGDACAVAVTQPEGRPQRVHVR